VPAQVASGTNCVDERLHCGLIATKDHTVFPSCCTKPLLVLDGRVENRDDIVQCQVVVGNDLDLRTHLF